MLYLLGDIATGSGLEEMYVKTNLNFDVMIRTQISLILGTGVLGLALSVLNYQIRANARWFPWGDG